ncbi:Uncharacterized protein APZ42_000300 [Daphnia magna]|uniref:Uncharacterized protein n=1 Tax=Daphnia magna TaxID=35525 RepID=A0A164JRW9_9CRUS|nr:Uncharacterized protein APZ42_000300 [Daphnia magna]
MASRYFSKDFRQSSLDHKFSTTTKALTTDSLLSVQDFLKILKVQAL